MNPIVLLDPGYENSSAHHQTVNLGIAGDCKKSGTELVIVAAEALSTEARRACEQSGVRVIPFFTTPCYPDGADHLPRQRQEVFSALVASEIVRLFDTGILNGGEHIILHTGYSFHINGLAQALFRLAGRLSGRVLVSLMFHPGARVNAERLEIFDARALVRYRLALKLLHAASARAGIYVVLATSCNAYRNIYQTFWPGGEVLIHPAVVYRSSKASRPSVTVGKDQVLLYLGGAKKDKGLVFSARVGIACAPAMPDVRFVFHFNRDFPGAERFASVIQSLEEAGKIHQNVEIISGSLNEAGYDCVLEQSDIVCLLYDPAHYRFKTSGVFWDALRFPHLDWLVAANTWVAGELAELNLPCLQVPYMDVDTAVAALCDMLVHRRGARRAAPPEGARLEYLNLLNQRFGAWVHAQLRER